jgi:Tat protein secretion system quality control protein TatD with DNase activity
MRHFILIATVTTLTLFYQATTYGSETNNAPVLGVEKAMELSIADAHFHVIPTFMEPADLLKMMDSQKIKWAGGAGYMAPDARMAKFHKMMKQRLKLYGGQRESVNAYASHGAAPFEDPSHPAATEMLSQIEAGLKDGRFTGIGELHINTLYTAPNRPGLRRKLPVDSPTFRAVFDLAQKYKAPIDIHIEWDSDTVEQLKRILTAYPHVQVKLAHCGKTSTADDIRTMMTKFSNVNCDLSSRPGRHPYHTPSVVIFTADGFQQDDWRQLIEDFPDRFTVGIDDVESWSEYKTVVGAIRKGLLANLRPEVAEKVAYKNADRLYGGY